MKSLYESILDSDKDITIKAKAKAIVDSVMHHSRVSQEDRRWLEKQVAVWKPVDQDEMYDVIENYIEGYGNNKSSLNWIDTSEITSLIDLFLDSGFNGDISKWNTSKVESLNSTFLGADFNGNLSKWDVSNVKNFDGTFARSKFNNNSIRYWNVSKGQKFYSMFQNTNFDQNISSWDIDTDADTGNMFYRCPIRQIYKPKFT